MQGGVTTDTDRGGLAEVGFMEEKELFWASTVRAIFPPHSEGEINWCIVGVITKVLTDSKPPDLS